MLYPRIESVRTLLPPPFSLRLGLALHFLHTLPSHLNSLGKIRNELNSHGLKLKYIQCFFGVSKKWAWGDRGMFSEDAKLTRIPHRGLLNSASSRLVINIWVEFWTHLITIRDHYNTLASAYFLVMPFRDKVNLALEAKVNGSQFKLNSDVNYQMGNGINERSGSLSVLSSLPLTIGVHRGGSEG